MNTLDSRVAAALDSAFELIDAAAAAAIAETPSLLQAAMSGAPTYHERSQLAAALEHLLAQRNRLARGFGEALRSKVTSDLSEAAVGAGALPTGGESQWASIGLVEEDQVQADIAYSRIGQVISHACDAELREQSGYMSALLRHGRADPERDPLRGAVIGWAMHRAIEGVTHDSSIERLLAKQLGETLAKAMKGCYALILVDLKARGIRKAALVGHSMDAGPPRAGSGAGKAAVLPEDALKIWEQSLTGRLVIDAGDGAGRWEPRTVGAPDARMAPEAEARAVPEQRAVVDAESTATLFDKLLRGETPAALRAHAASSPAARAMDTTLSDLVRTLNQRATDAESAYAASAAGAAKADNLIRAHRAELQQASTGKLDHLVIEIVGDLFDAIFADPEVQPQIARQLARLQLPVLRVAMRDPAFFASRGHPVRRFVNRIASMGAAIEDLDSGPGRDWLKRTDELVRQIVQGEFEQVALFEDRLLELERFAAEQARAEITASPAAHTIQQKESEWRRLSRFSHVMRGALASLPIDPYLRDFLSQPWCQAVVSMLREDGTESEASLKLRSAGLDLAVSVLPKRSLDDRKRFVSALPGLMAALQQMMDLVRWPENERDAFFEKLIAAHAGSLKAAPWTDLDHNLHVKRLELIFRTPIVREADAAAAPPPTLRAPTIEQRYSSDEAKRLGLIDEGDIDWARPAVPDPAMPDSALPDRDVPAPAATPGQGPREEGAGRCLGADLRAQLQVGLSYRLLLESQWQKVRLSYMSPGRNFFMFTHGAYGRRSISMTARMVDRLCAAQRLRAHESAPLIDRVASRLQQRASVPASNPTLAAA